MAHDTRHDFPPCAVGAASAQSAHISLNNLSPMVCTADTCPKLCMAELDLLVAGNAMTITPTVVGGPGGCDCPATTATIIGGVASGTSGPWRMLRGTGFVAFTASGSGPVTVSVPLSSVSCPYNICTLWRDARGGVTDKCAHAGVVHRRGADVHGHLHRHVGYGSPVRTRQDQQRSPRRPRGRARRGWNGRAVDLESVRGGPAGPVEEGGVGTWWTVG